MLIVMNNVDKEPLWKTFVGAFRALPAWQKAAIGVTALVLAPGTALVLGITAISMFPFFLFGRFEGDGDQSLTHEVGAAVRHARAHTEEVYSR